MTVLVAVEVAEGEVGADVEAFLARRWPITITLKVCGRMSRFCWKPDCEGS